MKHYKLFINNEWRDSQDGTVAETINPATEQPWASFAVANTDDVNATVTAAYEALYEGPWSKMTATQRGAMLYKLADLCAEHSIKMGDVETMDSGKLAKETRGQTGYVADYYRYYAGLADKIQGAVLPIDKPDMRVYTTREPIGVVAAIVPWNAQMFLTATKVGPALAAGCTIIIKASELAPAPMFEFAELVAQAGFPPGVINVITGDGETCGKPLTSHEKIARVAFTGGPETARQVIRNTAENFSLVSLELGGKSPIIVFDDANLEGAVNGIIAGNFGASGQSCVAGSRVFIQAGVYDQLIATLTERARQIVLGDPLADATQMGPLATKVQQDRCKNIVAKSVEQGAKLLHGGKQPAHLKQGWYFEPTILACPDQDIESVRTELFGPVMSIIKFKTEDEAIAMANDTQFGLGAGVFTENAARAIRVPAKIRSGIVWVNTYRAISPIAPFGGFKMSGQGREAGIDAVYDYTRTKTTWINISATPMANPFVMR